MTFSLLGRCSRTGQIGSAVSTSAIGVGGRVPWLAAGVGGVLTQALADPGAGLRGLYLLRSGCDAAQTVAALLAASPHGRFRQFAVLDGKGGTACWHGNELLSERGGAEGPGVVAIGNALASADVPRAMRDAFIACPEEPLAERLWRGLAAGHAAGGQRNPVFSAGLRVMGAEPYPFVDLRVDKQPDPIMRLRELWDEYRPMAEWFVTRARSPDEAPPQP